MQKHTYSSIQRESNGKWHVPGGGSSHISYTQCCWGWINDAFLFQCLHIVNWINKAASMCICITGYVNMKEGGRDFGIKLGVLSRFSRFWSPFIPCMDVKHLSSLLYLFLSTRCMLVSDSYGVVDWIFTGEPSGSHSTLTFFLSLSPSAHHCLLNHPSVSYFSNRGAIWREGDTGESWGHPEPHSGRCSHRCGAS